MKSLPTSLTTAALNNILNQMKGLPSATINRSDTIVTVTATKKKTGETVTVFSAASANGKLWHAMAVPGLISPV